VTAAEAEGVGRGVAPVAETAEDVRLAEAALEALDQVAAAGC
jgi:hypothetical protein